MTKRNAGRPEVLYEFRGQQVSLTRLASQFGLNRTTLHYRVVTLGLPLERAVLKAIIKPHEIPEHSPVRDLP